MEATIKVVNNLKSYSSHSFFFSLFSFLLAFLFGCCSAVEQPDVVFSVEQGRCGRADAPSPVPVLEDCKTADICDSDPDNEGHTTSSQTGDAGSNPSSTADLFFKLKEKPEELLQLAPEAGEVMPLTGEMVQRFVI